jgi:hypothetical protein
LQLLLKATNNYDTILAQFISHDQEFMELLAAKQVQTTSPAILEYKCSATCQMPARVQVQHQVSRANDFVSISASLVPRLMRVLDLRSILFRIQQWSQR